jgi:hypothetical protein
MQNCKKFVKEKKYLILLYLMSLTIHVKDETFDFLFILTISLYNDQNRICKCQI